MISPEHGWPAASTVALGALELALLSVVFAWVVAIATHAGGHLDNGPARPRRSSACRRCAWPCQLVAARALARADRAR